MSELDNQIDNEFIQGNLIRHTAVLSLYVIRRSLRKLDGSSTIADDDSTCTYITLLGLSKVTEFLVVSFLPPLKILQITVLRTEPR